MKNTMKAKETTTRVRNSSNHWPWWRGLLFIELLLGLAVLAVSPLARAVSPPPDGGYSGLNTAEATDALFSLTTGESNTAMGFEALYSNTTGSANVAVGGSALQHNTGSNNTACGYSALWNNTIGIANTAHGYGTLGEQHHRQR